MGRAICDHLFPEGLDHGKKEGVNQVPVGRIPLVGIAGSEGGQHIARLVAWLLHLSGRHTGLACADGLFLDQRCIDSADSAHWEAGQRLLMNRSVQAAVFENSAESILRNGLAYDRCQVGVVTDLGGAASLAEFDITEEAQMYRVLRAQVDAVLPGGAAVLNATPADLAAMQTLCDGEVIFYSTDPGAAALAAHRDSHGRALYLRQDQIVLATGATEAFLPGLGKLTAWRGRNQRGDMSEATLLAATGAAWALGIPLNLIGAGIEAFGPLEKTVAGAL